MLEASVFSCVLKYSPVIGCLSYVVLEIWFSLFLVLF